MNSPSRRYLAAGWFAFTISGTLYLVSSIKAGDMWSAAGAIVWLIAVGLFLTAMRTER